MAAIRIIDDHDELENSGTKTHDELEGHLSGLDSYDFPGSDGQEGQVLTTNGDGNIIWDKPSDNPGFWKHSGSTIVNNQSAPTNWVDLDLSSIVGMNRALVMLKIFKSSSGAATYYLRPNDDNDDYRTTGFQANGINAIRLGYNEAGLLMIESNENGIIEWMSSKSDNVTVTVIGYIR